MTDRLVSFPTTRGLDKIAGGDIRADVAYAPAFLTTRGLEKIADGDIKSNSTLNKGNTEIYDRRLEKIMGGEIKFRSAVVNQLAVLEEQCSRRALEAGAGWVKVHRRVRKY